MGDVANRKLKRDYYAELLNVARTVSPGLESIHADVDVSISTEPPNLEESVEAIEQLKNHRAGGICMVLAETLKYGGMGIKEWLHDITVEAWQTGKVPQDWRKALIVLIFKSGDATAIDNYRGISLMSIPAKAYSILVGSRLKKWIDENLLEVQFGFRPHRGCCDAIFCTRRVLVEAINKKHQMFACFLDLLKAYDCAGSHMASF